MSKITIMLVAIVSLTVSLVKAPMPFSAYTLDERAAMASMSVEEFEFISSVVEAESNRTTESTEGRRYIALCILCRVRDNRFPDTITGVLTQSGQFSTVRNGHSVTNRTDMSDRAVIEAVNIMRSGADYPWVLYFNCRGYNNGTPYGCIGDNYFMTVTPNIDKELFIKEV